VPLAVVNLEDKFARFSEHSKPKILASLNDDHIKVVKPQGEFVWHKHDETDEPFLVTKGSRVIRFRDRDVTLGAGELLVVPKGVEHLPVAEEECKVLLIEPADTLKAGGAGGSRTALPEWL
jgi:mannose-6-phosphate isomerase-like protein (cupin superfamily)